MKVLKAIVNVVVAGAIAAGTYYVTQMSHQEPAQDARRGGRGGAGGPVAVIVEEARVADVPVFLDGVGSAKARNSITVRPQVEGRLISIKFKEGQDVKKGDLLAKIDPVTYQAQLDQALAKKALDESQLATIKRDLARYEKIGTLAITEKQIDTQRQLVIQQEAQIKSDAASIDNLTAILNYTDIKAPIDGRVGIRNVDEGNLVRTGDSQGIVTITEVRPISVLFTLPQQQLPALSKAMANAGLKVEAYTTDSRSLLDTGTLQVVDNQVDSQTGTIRIKAEFPNDKLQLWPGQFVNVRLYVDTLKGVVVVSAAAVQRGPNGPFVYAVGPDDTVSLRPVKIAQQSEKDVVIAEGVKAGEKLVTSGFGRLEEGAKVKVSEGRKSEPQSPVPPVPPAAGGSQPNPETISAAPPDGQRAQSKISGAPRDASANKAAADASPVEGAPPKGRRGRHGRDGTAAPIATP
jgi:membrane fusion protein, multidrug efflux system